MPDVDWPFFLGVCRSALVRAEGMFQDFYQVGDLVALPFFPQNLQGCYLLLGFPTSAIGSGETIRIVVRDFNSPARSTWVDVEGENVESPRFANYAAVAHPYTPEASESTKTRNLTPVLLSSDADFKLMPIPMPPLLVPEPTKVEVLAQTGGQERTLGSFQCRFIRPAALSAEERQAIRSRPGAVRGLQLQLRCKICDDTFKLYDVLDPDDSEPPPMGMVKLSQAPESWKCLCGKTTLPLQYLKSGAHDLFRSATTIGTEQEIKFTPLYQPDSIAAIIQAFERVILSSPPEEQVQKFIESHPILWNFLAPKRIWNKPPILSHFKADFAILTRTNTLYFIEIEKPTTKLFKRRGGIHSKLQVGLDQLREWQDKVRKHRAAVLDCLELDRTDVEIKFLLVAGLARAAVPNHLSNFKSSDSPADAFFCFDELASILHSTQLAIAKL